MSPSDTSKNLLSFYSTLEASISKLYLYHVSANDTKKDTFAVASIVDEICLRLSSELPEVSVIHILSHNARCYQNVYLSVMLPYIAKSHGLIISSYVNSETKDGKSLVDAHFSILMSYINSTSKTTRRTL